MNARTLLRFWSQVNVQNDGCWLWTSFINPNGYGQFMWEGRRISAHRFSFILHKGPIPKGLEVDHVCRVRRCVNPEHLRAVTHRENILCGDTVPARHARQTRCFRGHEFTPENTWSNPRKIERHCRTCHKLKARELRAKLKAAAVQSA